MKYLRILILVFTAYVYAFFACNKPVEETPPPPTIEGKWTALQPLRTNWHYDFSGGVLTQYIISFGDTTTWRQFPYVAMNDTVIIGDPADPIRLWKIQFHGDSILEAHNIKPGNMIYPYNYFRKVQ